MTRHAESEVLSAYLDGELERAAAASVESHLGECPDCAARLEGLQETVASLRRLERPPLPEAVTRGLRQRLQRERQRPRRAAWLDALLPWRSLQPGMAAAVLVSGALLFLAYAGYVQRERAAPPVVFSAESREVPETAPAPSAGPENPPAEELAPIAPAPPPSPAARRLPAAPPAAKSESALATGVRDAAAPNEEEQALADADAADAAGAAGADTADTTAAAEPRAERSRREARTAAAELKAAGEIGGAAAAPSAAPEAAPAAEQPAPPAGADEPLLLGPGIEKPVKIAGDMPEFGRLRDVRWPHFVVLEIVVSGEGRMEMHDIRIVKPADLDPRIAAELRRSLATWRYRPALRDGKPVAVRMTLTLNINLQ